MTQSKQEPIYLEYNDALDLVDRISKRAKLFKYEMSQPEKEAMAELLSEIGVMTRDIVSVTHLADNYVINAEIVEPQQADQYSDNQLDDALFRWEEDSGVFFCLSW